MKEAEEQEVMRRKTRARQAVELSAGAAGIPSEPMTDEEEPVADAPLPPPREGQA